MTLGEALNKQGFRIPDGPLMSHSDDVFGLNSYYVMDEYRIHLWQDLGRIVRNDKVIYEGRLKDAEDFEKIAELLGIPQIIYKTNG